jgi:hypothetical protein
MEDRRNYDKLAARFDELERLLIQNRDLPQNETISRLFRDLKAQISVVDKKLDDHMKEASQKLSAVDDIMQFGKIGTAVFNFIVKSIIGIGIISAGIIGFKAWIVK